MKKSKAVIGVLCGILAVALVVASVMVQIYGGRRQEAKANKKTTTLVVYFSATGTTKKAARKVKKATKGKLYRIKAAQPYTREAVSYTHLTLPTIGTITPRITAGHKKSRMMTMQDRRLREASRI